MRTISVTLQADDAEPILRKAAYDAARFGALADYITRKTHDAPGDYFQMHGLWQQRFLAAKRTVEAFGVEYEQTSEAETLTVFIEHVGGKRRKLASGFYVIEGSQPDYKHPLPAYRREVHSYACHAAADRVVRAWRTQR